MLHVMNGGTSPATLSLAVANMSGTVVYSTADYTVEPQGSIRFATADLPAGVTLPGGYGNIRVSAAAPRSAVFWPSS